MGKLLTKEDLLKKEELQIERIEFEGGDFVFVRGMTGHERDMFEKSMMIKNRDKKGNVTSIETVIDDFRAKLAAITLCDEDGKSLLQPSDYMVLTNNMSAKRLELIVNAAQKLNAISEEDKEEIVKNSVAGQAGDSNSDSVES